MNKFFLSIIIIFFLSFAQIYGNSIEFRKSFDKDFFTFYIENNDNKINLTLENRGVIKINKLKLNYKNLSIKTQKPFFESNFNSSLKSSIFFEYKWDNFKLSNLVSSQTNLNIGCNIIKYKNSKFFLLIGNYNLVDKYNNIYNTPNKLDDFNKGILTIFSINLDFFKSQIDTIFTPYGNYQKKQIYLNFDKIKFNLEISTLKNELSYYFLLKTKNSFLKLEKNIFGYSVFCGKGNDKSYLLESYLKKRVNYKKHNFEIKLCFKQSIKISENQNIKKENIESISIKSKINNNKTSLLFGLNNSKIFFSLLLNDLIIKFDNKLSLSLLYEMKNKGSTLSFKYTYPNFFIFKYCLQF